MAIEANAKITLRGGSEALKTLQGITRATGAASKAGRDEAKAQESAQKAAIRAHQKRMQEEARAVAAGVKLKERAAQQSERAAEREAKSIARIQQQQAERWQSLAHKSADYRIREDARVTAAAQREAAKQVDIARKTAAAEVEAARKRVRDIGGLVGVAAASALAGGVHAVSTAKGVSGAKSAQERLVAANDFRERLVRVTNDAGMTGSQREAVQGQVLAASQSTGMGIDELAGVLETGQGQFSNLQYFADQLESIGRIAKAGGADARELATAIGFANQAFGLTGKQAEDSGYMMKAAANRGAIEMSDLASSFAPLASTYAETTKHKGEAGYKEFLGMAEAMGTSGYTGERAATRVQGVLAAVSGVDVQKKLKGIGVKGFVGKDGSLDIPSLVRQLATNKKFESAAVRQDIFGDIRAQQGIEGLVTARKRVNAGDKTASDIDTFLSMDAAGGRASVDAGMTAMQGEGFFKAQVQNANMQADTVNNMGELNDQVGWLTKAANDLELKFGALSFWAGSIATIGVASTLGTLAKSLLGSKAAAAGAEAAVGGGVLSKAGRWLGGAAVGTAGAFGTALASTGAAVGTLAAGTLAAGAVIGGSVGGAVGYGANKLTSAIRDDGQDISDLIVSKLIDRARGQSLTSDGKRNSDGTLVAATKEQTRVLQSIESGMRARDSKPSAGGKREPD